MLELMQTPEQYHADFSRDSNSSISLFNRSVPRYAAERVYKTHRPKPSTPEMIIGQAFDCLLLENGDFYSRYAVAPECDRRTKLGKAQWEEFQEESKGKQVLALEDMALIQGMREAVLADPDARNIIEQAGECQRVIEWTHTSGRPLKLRADKILANGLIVDVKTAADVRLFALSNSAATYGYHRQAALYLEGASTVGIDGPFLFLVVGKDEPHEVVLYTLDDAAIIQGKAENDRLINDLERRWQSGDWSSRYKGINSLSIPKWAFN